MKKMIGEISEKGIKKEITFRKKSLKPLLEIRTDEGIIIGYLSDNPGKNFIRVCSLKEKKKKILYSDIYYINVFDADGILKLISSYANSEPGADHLCSVS